VTSRSWFLRESDDILGKLVAILPRGRIRIGAQVFIAARLDEKPRILWLSLLTAFRRIPGLNRLTPDEVWVKLGGLWFRVAPAQAEMEGYLQTSLLRVYEPEAPFIARRGDVVVDGGANVGFYAMLQASRGARVVAFEPNPQTMARLRAGIARNGFDALVTTVPAALADQAGKNRFYVADSNTIGGTIFQNLDDSQRRPTTEVDLVALDEALRGLDIAHVDLLKLDVEGAECLALDGAVRSLGQVRAVVVECHGRELRDGCLGRLQRAGMSAVRDDGRYLAFVSS
jgi:FkbM family methyltransferase